MQTDKYTSLRSKNSNKIKIFYDILVYDSLFFLILFIYLLYRFNKNIEFFKKGIFYKLMHVENLYKTSNWIEPLILATLISFVIGFIVYKYLSSSTKKQNTDDDRDTYLRGTKLSRDIESYNREIMKSEDNLFFQLLLKRGQTKYDYFLIPFNRKVFQSYLLFGRPGSGKTNIIRQIIFYTTRNHSKNKKKSKIANLLTWSKTFEFINPNCLILDVKGDDYTSVFYREGRDLLFNPADKRSLVWNIFDEISTIPDISTVVEILIPDSVKGEPFWAKSSQAVLEAIFYYIKFTKKEKARNEDVLELSSKTANELIQIFSENEKIKKQTMLAIAALSSGEKTAPNILAFMNSHLSSFKNLKSKADKEENQFTISKFLSSKGMHIYMNNRNDVAGFVKPVMSLFTTLLIMKILSTDSKNLNPTLLVLDEFTSLQAIHLLDELVLKGRSKKVVIIFGIQTLDKISKTYGDNALANSLVSAVSNQVFLANSGETATAVSGWIGEQEVDREAQNKNISQKETTTTFSVVQTIKKAVLPSQIAGLKDLQAYAKFGTEEYYLLDFDYQEFTEKPTETFILNPDFSIEQATEDAEFIEKLENTKLEDIKKDDIDTEVINIVKNINIDNINDNNIDSDNVELLSNCRNVFYMNKPVIASESENYIYIAEAEPANIDLKKQIYIFSKNNDNKLQYIMLNDYIDKAANILNLEDRPELKNYIV